VFVTIINSFAMLQEYDFHARWALLHPHVGNKAHFIGLFFKMIHYTDMKRDLDLLFHPMWSYW